MGLIDVIALIVVIFISVLYAYFKYSFQYWKWRNVPCDEPSIPYGNIKYFGKTIPPSLFFKELYDKYKTSSGKNGTNQKLCGVYFFTSPCAVLLDLSLIKNVLVKDFATFSDRGIFYNEIDDPLGVHLLSLESEKWKELRQKLTPTFTSGKMKFMFPTVIDVSERFRKTLSEIVQEHDELEIQELLARFTTDVIGTCAFGIECNSLKDPNAEFRHYGREVFGKRRHNAMFCLFIGEFKKLARKLHVKTIRDDVSNFFMKVVHDTVKYREENNIERNDFMDLLIKLKNQETTDKSKSITLNECAAQAFIFFLAGFETSSTTLTFCLYELAQNQDIQEKARKEIRDVLAKHNGNFTYEAMMDMRYIEQVLEETLRKYCIVGQLSRTANADYQVPGTDIILEKGMRVFIPTYAIQRDSEYYPDPEKFDPDRFSSEESKKRNPMTWLPFGGGPRNCIGLRFGMMQARIGLVTLLNNFELTLSSRTRVPLVYGNKAFILSPESGMYLKMKSIKP